MSRRKRKRQPSPKSASHKQQPPQPPPPAPVAFNTTDPPASNGNPNRENNGEPPREPKWSVTWSGTLAGVIGLATIAQALIAGFQWVTMRQQSSTMVAQNCLIQEELAEAKAANKAAEKAADAAIRSNQIADRAAIASLRAYVGIESAEFNLEDGETWRLDLSVKNYGQTPAYSTVIHADFTFNSEPPKSTRLETIPISRIVIGPGSTVPYETRTRITADRLKELKSPTSTLLIHGSIMFKDVFDRQWLATFRMSWGGKFGTNKPIFTMEGNEEEEITHPAPEPDPPSD